MPRALNKTIICFHISAVLYFLLGLGCFLAFPLVALYDVGMGLGELVIIIGLGGFCVLLGVGVEVVIWHLKRGQNWAWITGLCIAGIYIPSIFMPLGIVALLGLIDARSKSYCEQTRAW